MIEGCDGHDLLHLFCRNVFCFQQCIVDSVAELLRETLAGHRIYHPQLVDSFLLLCSAELRRHTLSKSIESSSALSAASSICSRSRSSGRWRSSISAFDSGSGLSILGGLVNLRLTGVALNCTR